MTQAKFAKLVEKLHDAERDHVRAMRKWDKLREQVRRAERALDKEFARRADDIPGSLDFRTLAKASK